MVAQVDADYLQTGLTNAAVRVGSYLLVEGRPLTTRGRMINPAVRRLLDVAASRKISYPLRMPTFIVGMGRSGTTLLGSVLSTHPDVAWLNEPKLVWNVVCPFEDVIGSYSRTPGRLILEAGDVSPEMKSRAQNVYRNYLWATRRLRVLDKYPELVFRAGMVTAIFPDAHFLVVQRRAASAVSSILQWNRLHAKRQADWWGRDGRKWHVMYDELIAKDSLLSQWVQRDPRRNEDETMAIAEWVVSSEAALGLLKRQPNAMLVRYEDLVDKPVTTLNQAFTFMDVPECRPAERFATAVCRPTKGLTHLTHPMARQLENRIRSLEGALGYGQECSRP